MRAQAGVSSCALALMMIFGCADADFTADCPTVCDCKWQSGNKAAICSEQELKEVPDKLSSEIQNFDLSNNPLINISPRAFDNVGLRNLKKLWLHDCKLSTIDKDSFSGLSIMVELDLSKNDIKSLHPSTFNETIKLRHLIISENKIEKIEDGLFNNLQNLQKIDLGHNLIYMLGMNSFRNLPMLKTIFLENNNLSHVDLETINKLKSIASLVLHGNPWKCDCNLRSFRNWVINRNLHSQSTACAEPESLRNRLWNVLSSEEFACGPQILKPYQGATIKANSKNITLSCYVVGNPTPQVNWVQNSKILGNDSRKNHFTQRYEIKETKTHGVSARWTNLTIISVEYEDSGEYTCIAKNPAGVEQRTVSLNVNRTPVATTENPERDTIFKTHTWLIPGMVAVGMILIILIIVLSFCIYCKQRDNKRPAKLSFHSSDGEALEKVSVVPEIQKSLITSVNLLNKPIKKYNMPSTATSGTTKMSKTRKVLLDKDTVFSPNEDENRSMVLSNQLSKRAMETLSVDSPIADDRVQYSQNLISILPTSVQTSPAVSSLSTAPDSCRLPLQVQAQSSLISPTHIYENLPLSRSQFPVPEKSVYDNIRLRKTADGNSVVFVDKTKM